ncbi:hypothetical protein ACLBR5_01320 [Escherichia coli]
MIQQTRWSRRSSKNATVNIPLEETVVSPQAVFDAPQLTTVAKEWPLFSW